MSSRNTIVRLAGVTLPAELAQGFVGCRRHIGAAAGFSFLLNLLYLAPAIYMLQVYDRVVATGGKLTLLFVTMALLVALLTLSALDGVRGRLMIRASLRLDSIVAPLLLQRMRRDGGPESVRAMRDFETVRQWLGSPLANAILDAPWAPIFILVGFLLHFWIGILALASVMLLLLLAWRNQLSTREPIEAATRALSEAQAGEQAVAAQAQTIRALGMSRAMAARQEERRDAGLLGLAAAHLMGSRFASASRFVRLFVQSAALAVGAILAIAGEISAGAIVAASILLGRALQPVEALIGGWSSLSAARAALQRLAAAMERPLDAERERTSLPPPRGRVAAEQVAVRTGDGRMILSGISFATGEGEILGIVGPSGSGKSTLAKVIAGALLPSLGVVRIDGAQRADWDPDLLGRHIGYLPQEASLLEGTIAENISRFSRWDGMEAEQVDAAVVAAATAAGVHEMILQLPQGYDTVLGHNGTGVSAGQGQRIALARALFGNPQVLILDEPNAFLDAEGEGALLAAIRGAAARGATVLVIAHRRSVLPDAQRLLVLDGGRVRMLGPAQEVAARLNGAAPVESAA